MEFKVTLTAPQSYNRIDVDIGTEWNLKQVQGVPWKWYFYVDIGTEWNLKERACCTFTAHLQVDIGTEWNLKRERLTADPALVREQSGI